MKRFLHRLLGDGADNDKTRRPEGMRRLEIEPFSHGLVRIPALDFFGPHAASSNGQYHLIWQDRNPEGTIGGHRYEGHGTWSLLTDSGALLAKGQLERPQDGHVADDGTFILSDWMFGDGLKGRLQAFRADGRKLLEREFSANMASSSLSDDGRFAICQTANAPGSPDSCRYFLFDLEKGEEITSWEQETGWADGYEFDSVNERIYLSKEGKDRVAYGFDGKMVDREGWQRTRIAAGDLGVIRSVLEGVGHSLTHDLRTAIFAGLDVVAESDDIWSQAKALRLRGEMHEQAGEVDEAIASYEQALAIDPQVGVSRRLGKLQRSTSPVSKKARTTKVSRFEKQAERLGIRHEVVMLEQGVNKEWRMQPSGAITAVEVAALEHYRAEGWEGVAAEGGLILTLIKAASFKPLAGRNADTFVEALYAQNVAFDEDRFDPARMIDCISKSTRSQIEANWRVIAATAGDTPAFYPAVRREHVLGLYESLGTRRLAQIAEIFATAPYDLRAGWPDLTLWKETTVRFIEVKAPGDSMHAKQARLISTLLLPLGFDVALAEIRPL